MKILFTDIETTGLMSKRNEYGFRNCIIEVAGVLYDTETQQIIDTFNQLAKPAHPIPAKITEITGITNEMVANALTEKEMLRNFSEWVFVNKPDKFAAHNYIFEKRFYNDIMKDLGLKWPDLPYEDTMILARKYNIPVARTTSTGRKSYSLESIAEGIGISYNAHRAMPDTMTMLEVYKYIQNNYMDIKKKRKNLGF